MNWTVFGYSMLACAGLAGYIACIRIFVYSKDRRLWAVAALGIALIFSVFMGLIAK